MKKLLCLLCLLPSLALGQGRYIEINGVGAITLVPDRAELSGAVSHIKATPEEARQAVDQVVNAWLAEVEKSQVSQGQYSAGNINLSPRYEYQKDNKRKLIGYEARRDVRLQVEIEAIGGWLSQFTKLGINEIASPRYFTKDSASLEDKLYQLALEDALSKAKVLATHSGDRVGQVLSIIEPEHGGAAFPKMMMRAESMSADAGRYQPAEQALEIRLRVKMALESASAQ